MLFKEKVCEDKCSPEWFYCTVFLLKMSPMHTFMGQLIYCSNQDDKVTKYGKFVFVCGFWGGGLHDFTLRSLEISHR